MQELDGPVGPNEEIIAWTDQLDQQSEITIQVGEMAVSICRSPATYWDFNDYRVVVFPNDSFPSGNPDNITQF